MRTVYISEECQEYLDKSSSERVRKKFQYMLEILVNQKIVHSSFVEKLVNTEYYELKIRAENQVRVIIFTIDSQDFNQSTEVILLNAFLKRTNKDYRKAVEVANKLLKKYDL